MLGNILLGKILFCGHMFINFNTNTQAFWANKFCFEYFIHLYERWRRETSSTNQDSMIYKYHLSNDLI